ncbi:MAG: thioredoxin [Candidatus Kapaibacteriales bacterium]
MKTKITINKPYRLAAFKEYGNRMKAKNITTQEFKENIFNYTEKTEWNYEGELPLVIDFYADWCAPCKAVAPIMDELSNDYEDRVEILKVDTEKEKELSAAFGIRSIPSVLFVPKEGQPKMAIGAMDKKGYQNAIEDVLGVSI